MTHADQLALQAAAGRASSTTAGDSRPTTPCSRSNARCEPPSQRAFQLKGVAAMRKVDALTIDIQLEAPDAVLPEKLQFVAMMNKAWSEKHGVGPRAGLQRQAGDLRGPQRQRHRAVQAGALRARRAHRAAAPRRLVGLVPTGAAATSTSVELGHDQVRRDAAGGAGLGRGRPGARPAVPGHRPAEGRPAARAAADAPTSASSTWPSTSRATNCRTATSRAATRSRTCACARRSTTRSTCR